MLRIPITSSSHKIRSPPIPGRFSLIHEWEYAFGDRPQKEDLKSIKRSSNSFCFGMRKRRLLLDGASYHVTARINRKEMALNEIKIKDMFLTVIVQAKKRFVFSLTNLVVMGNHYHMIIKPEKNQNLSEIMKWIQQTMAIRYNRAHGLSGHFWGDRYFSWIIPNLVDFLKTFLYIQENPVKAGLVSTPDDWPWGLKQLKRRFYWLFEDPPPEIMGTDLK